MTTLCVGDAHPVVDGSETTTGSEIHVFGTLRAWHAGRLIRLGPPRHRALLGLLVARLGKVVPAERLIEELWSGRLPQHPTATLQTYVSHLRRVLSFADREEGEPIRVRYQAPGYVLDADPGLIDVCRFERLVKSARRHAASEAFGRARDDLTTALGLWRGPPYEEFAGYAMLADEGRRLEELRLSAVVLRADSCLALDEADAVLAELQQEVDANPTHERLVGHLMTCLYQLGRQAEALRLYEQTRSRLADELGVDPSEELQQVHSAILRQRITVAAPKAIVTPPQVNRGPDASAAPDPGSSNGAASPRNAPPCATVGDGRHPFVGRDRELATLRSYTIEALRGDGHLTAVLGEPGIGRTELVLQMISRLTGPRPEAVWGYCVAGEGVPQYWPWAQILRRLAASRPREFQAATAAFDTLLSPLTLGPPSAGPRPQAGGAGVKRDRFLVYDAVSETLLALAADRPLLIVLEDLHWADDRSAELLELLRTRLHGVPLSIVMTAEDATGPGNNPIVTRLLRASRIRTLRLGGLAEAETGAIVEAQLGVGVAADVVRVLHERSGGNPYFLNQFLTLVGDPGTLANRGTVTHLNSQIPEGVREVLGRRLGTVPTPVREVLRAVSVLGPSFDLSMVHHVARTETDAESTIDVAIRTGLLHREARPPYRLRFTHTLVQEMLGGELSGKERRCLHARVADARQPRGRAGSGASSECEAHHAWKASGALSAAEVLPRLFDAAEQAETALCYDRAEMWLRRGARQLAGLPSEAPSTQVLELRLLRRLFHVLVTLHGYGDTEAEVALHRSLTLSEGLSADRRLKVIRELCMVYMVTGRYDECMRALELVDAAERSDPRRAVPLSAPFFRGAVMQARGRLTEARAELERAIELSDLFAAARGKGLREHPSDPRIKVRLYGALTTWLAGAPDRTKRLREEALALAEQSGRPMDRAIAYYTDSLLAALDGDVATADRSSLRGLETAARYGLGYWAAMLRVCRGWALVRLGSCEAGVSLIESAIGDLRGRRAIVRLPLHLGLLAQAQHEAGRPEVAATLASLDIEVTLRAEYGYLSARLPYAGLDGFPAPRFPIQMPENGQRPHGG